MAASKIIRRMASSAHALSGMTQYGGRRTVTLIPGDGVGPELTASVQRVFEAMKVPIDFEEISFHGTDEDAHDRLEEAITSLRRNGVGLKGVLSTPRGRATNKSLNMELRTELDLFANVVVCKTPNGVETRHKDVDVVIVRQNTEAEYSGLEHEISPGVVESLKVISRDESMRIAKFAFDYATRNDRKKVTAVHKANIMKQGDGLFLKCCREVAELYPDIEFEAMIVDNCSMQLVSRPQQFDVMVTPNLYGNIVGNIGAGLVGGAGMVPGFNFGTNYAVFEPGARQVGEGIKGTHKASPFGMLHSSAMMLQHIGFDSYADPLLAALNDVLDKGTPLTPDVGGSSTTEEVTDAIIERVAV
eukprot:TRINITY_DN9911_c0_g1_i3.p1 TRINITY_DN9911_c0_g1~~TRINITY_DN9911_c0_g1_i3.p1  ORF type:complete len:359 (+),score=105.20 TRINITY_DN9911_c0_g1_i3:17-1093(+)